MTGDTVLSVVKGVAGQPKVPRLEVKVVEGAQGRARPEALFGLRFRITNNESVPVTLDATLASKNPSRNGVHFPVLLTTESKLPSASHLGKNATLKGIAIKAHGTQVVRAYTLPHGDGPHASSEYQFRVTGNFGKNDPIDVSVGAAVVSHHNVWHWPWSKH